jgi:hypothetical protein
MFFSNTDVRKNVRWFSSPKKNLIRLVVGVFGRRGHFFGQSDVLRRGFFAGGGGRESLRGGGVARFYLAHKSPHFFQQGRRGECLFQGL